MIIPIEYKRFSTLIKGPYGIMEPQSEDNIHINPIEFRALCLVPLLACDTNGYRLGYGGGYYDKFLLCTVIYSDVVLDFHFRNTIMMYQENSMISL